MGAAECEFGSSISAWVATGRAYFYSCVPYVNPSSPFSGLLASKFLVNKIFSSSYHHTGPIINFYALREALAIVAEEVGIPN